MLNLSDSLLFLGVDSAWASGAIRLVMPDEKLSWRLPAAFALFDGLGSLLGSSIWPANTTGAEVRGITLAAVVAAGALLLVAAKRRTCVHATSFRRMVIFVAIPVLLATDNFLEGRVSLAFTSPMALAIANAANSWLMSFAGLAICELTAACLRRLRWAAPTSVP